MLFNVVGKYSGRRCDKQVYPLNICVSSFTHQKLSINTIFRYRMITIERNIAKYQQGPKLGHHLIHRFNTPVILKTTRRVLFIVWAFHKIILVKQVIVSVYQGRLSSMLAFVNTTRFLTNRIKIPKTTWNIAYAIASNIQISKSK